MEIKYNDTLIGRTSYGEDDEIGSKFATALATEIYKSFERMDNRAFCLFMEEYQCGAKEPTYTIDVTNCITERFDELKDMFVFDPEEKKYPFMSTAGWYYTAIDTKDYTKNYGGYITIELIMFGEKESPDDHSEEDAIATTYAPNHNVEDLLSIAFGHYGRGIKKYYPAWHTQYLDAPEVVHTAIDGL